MKKQEVTPLKKIAVINDISGFGKCSLTVSLPIISALGIECNPIPTAILSNQTGYDDFYSVDFTENMTPYIDVWKKQNVHFDAILTGYLASEKQVDIILDFIDHFGKNSLVFVECWENIDCLKAHLATPHMKKFMEDVKDLRVSSSLKVLSNF